MGTRATASMIDTSITLQGRFQVRIPHDRREAFYPMMLEILKQDQARVEQLALALYEQDVSQRGYPADLNRPLWP